MCDGLGLVESGKPAIGLPTYHLWMVGSLLTNAAYRPRSRSKEEGGRHNLEARRHRSKRGAEEEDVATAREDPRGVSGPSQGHRYVAPCEQRMGKNKS